jgi:O-antigen chain-terminating methyltransferase
VSTVPTDSAGSSQASQSGSDAAEIAELTALVQAIRDRVSARYPEPGRPNGDNGLPGGGIRVPVTDLMPVVHARDAAQAKIAAIGSVNPRPGGLVNSLIQSVKKTIARALQWFVRDQIVFNREMVAALEAVLEALNQQNRALVSVAGQANEQFRHAAARGDGMLAEAERLREEAKELRDIRAHWIEWRAGWERTLSKTEIELLRAMAELQAGFQHRLNQSEASVRETVKAQHGDYLAALARSSQEVQERLWAALAQAKEEYQRLIYAELRVIRQRASTSQSDTPQAGTSLGNEPRTASAAAEYSIAGLDYGRFAEQFRGPEEYVRKGLEFYRPFFVGLGRVLDIGCGRGEFLEMMREDGVDAIGIDLAEESVAQCRGKGLTAELADLFPYLAAQPEGAFDGIFSSQVVEHIEPARLPEMIRLCASRLRPGGLLAIETPNPECLAIFATHFYLDPTHVRPVPHPLLAFYMQEAGFGSIEVHPLSPAIESMPEVGELPEGFRRKFFGGLDYAILGRRF